MPMSSLSSTVRASSNISGTVDFKIPNQNSEVPNGTSLIRIREPSPVK
jgi:hypothetical protein